MKPCIKQDCSYYKSIGRCSDVCKSMDYRRINSIFDLITSSTPLQMAKSNVTSYQTDDMIIHVVSDGTEFNGDEWDDAIDYELNWLTKDLDNYELVLELMKEE